MFDATDVTVIFGQRKCGKSTLGRKIASCYPRLVVIDRMREWSGEGTFVTDSFESIALYLRDMIDAERFRAAFQFDIEAGNKEAVFSEVMRLCYKYGELTGNNLAVLIEEVQNFGKPHWVDPWLFESIMTGRHSNQAIIVSSQRPASVSKTLVSQATHVFIGRLFEKNDLDYVRGIIGDFADQVPELPRGWFLHYRPGEGIQRVYNR